MLSDIYALLREKDMLTGLWTKKAKYPETVTALSYEQHGYYEQAQTTYEQVNYVHVHIHRYTTTPQDKNIHGIRQIHGIKYWRIID